MRLPFRRTQKPVAPRVYEPGADSPYVPREGVWMASDYCDVSFPCKLCELPVRVFAVVAETTNGVTTLLQSQICESCGTKLVARLRRERESA